MNSGYQNKFALTVLAAVILINLGIFVGLFIGIQSVSVSGALLFVAVVEFVLVGLAFFDGKLVTGRRQG